MLSEGVGCIYVQQYIIYIYIYIYIYVYVYIYIYIYIYIDSIIGDVCHISRVHVCLINLYVGVYEGYITHIHSSHPNKHAHIDSHICAQYILNIYSYTCIGTFRNSRVHWYISTQTHTHTHTYTHIHTYIHTHTYTLTHKHSLRGCRFIPSWSPQALYAKSVTQRFECNL